MINTEIEMMAVGCCTGVFGRLLSQFSNRTFKLVSIHSAALNNSKTQSYFYTKRLRSTNTESETNLEGVDVFER